MSILVYRDGVLASDSLCVHCGVRSGNVTKVGISGASEKRLVGAVGPAGFVNMWLSSQVYAVPEQATGVWIDFRTGEVWQSDHYGKFLENADFFAWGAGAEIALGALGMGASAVQAVEVAIKLCIFCGGAVQSVSRKDVPDV